MELTRQASTQRRSKIPEMVKEAVKRFGSGKIVVAIDARRKYDNPSNLTTIETDKGPCWFEVYTYGGRISTGIDAIEWAQRSADLGAGEILVTSIDRDGTKMGFDIELTRAISERVKVPVIASGGAGEPTHFLEAFKNGKADATLAASVFHYGNYPIPVVKRYLHERGVKVRL